MFRVDAYRADSSAGTVDFSGSLGNDSPQLIDSETRIIREQAPPSPRPSNGRMSSIRRRARSVSLALASLGRPSSAGRLRRRTVDGDCTKKL
jgi:hypothetical protein